MIQPFAGLVPSIHPSVFVHDSAVIIGDVRLDEDVSIWPTAVLRGDMGLIEIGARTNIQDGAIAHDTGGISVTRIGQRCTIGHRAILHGCIVEDDCLIGMGAIVMDNAVIGRGSIVAAGALVTAKKVIPPGSMVMGSPGQVTRPVSAKDTEWIAYSWKVYLERAQAWRNR
jgi:carbonic anhydrase/acetyltransferase-like protein (isoleucine patch superfamily)